MTSCRVLVGCYLAVPVPAGQVQRGVGVEHAAVRRVLKDELILLMLKVISLKLFKIFCRGVKRFVDVYILLACFTLPTISG